MEDINETAATTDANRPFEFYLKLPEVQEFLRWCGERLYILLLLIIICITATICVRLARKRWYHRIESEREQPLLRAEV